MPVHPNSLKALEQNRQKTQFNSETAVICGRKGASVTNNIAIPKKKNLIELFEIAQQAKVPDGKVAERLRKAGLPDTFAGQMAYNVIQKAGTNPLMLQTLLKALGLLNDNPSVTVNTTPIIIGNENELQD